MSTITYNKQGTDPEADLIRVEGPITGERTQGVWTYKIKYFCDATVANDNFSSYGGVIPIYGDAQNIYGIEYYVTNVTISPVDDVTIAVVEVTYSRNSPYESGTVGATRSAEVITLDVAIDDKRLQDSGYYAGLAYEAGQNNQTQVAIGGIRYRYTEQLDSLSWTEPNLVIAIGVGVGQVGSPTGLDTPPDPTEGLWVFRGKEITEQPLGAGVDVTEEWEYSPIGWPGAFVAPPEEE